MQLCYCNSGELYHTCCAEFIDHGVIPTTPEQLMRSRYSAYAQGKVNYIEQTMRGPAAVGFDKASTSEWAQSVNWRGLRVLRAWQESDAVGYVEFMVDYTSLGAKHQMHEVSEFHLDNGRWFYVKGTQCPK